MENLEGKMPEKFMRLVPQNSNRAPTKHEIPKKEGIKTIRPWSSIRN